jgi:carboxylesterase
MAPVAERLAGRHPLWVVRVAGHDTTVEHLATTSWQDWERSAERGADALLAATPRIIAVGLSMGALLAMRLAVARPRQVAGLALLSPAVDVRRVAPWMRWPLRTVAALDARFPPARRLLAPLGMAKRASDIADPVVRETHPGYRRVPLRALLNLLRLQRACRHLGRRVTQPVLVVHALQDHTCPADAARVLYEALPSADKRLVLLPESFHVVTVDREREQVLGEIERFVTAIAGKAPASTST